MGYPALGNGLDFGMDRRAYIESRRRRYLAQAMEGIEQFDPFIPEDKTAEWVAFKARFRRKFQALATDAIELMSLAPTVHFNEHAVDIRDRLDLPGQP